MKFIFKAKSAPGEVREGIIEAENLKAATSELQKNGFFPITVVPESKQDIWKTVLKFYDRVTDKELVTFFRQLSILIEARVPIVSALSAIADQVTNLYFKKVMAEVIGDIKDGLSFSDSLAKHKDVFSSMALNVVKAGETSGNLRKSIEYVASNIERNYTLTSRVRSALIYPSIVLSLFFVIGFIMVSFVLPKLTQVIVDLNVSVPWYTSVVISLGNFMSHFWWAVALLIFAIIGGVIYYVKTPDGKLEWDHIKINLPVVGTLYRYIYIARFAENLGVLLSGGIPIIRALNTVSSVINNSVYEEVINRTAEVVKVGGNMSDVLTKSALFPPVVSNMIKIGEESGQIDSVLGHISKFYDQETDMMTKNLSTLLEPVLIILIGLGVCFMAFAIIMPIYNIAGQIK